MMAPEVGLDEFARSEAEPERSEGQAAYPRPGNHDPEGRW